MRRIEVVFINSSCAYVRGHGSRALVTARTGRSPVWATLSRGWVCQPHTARDVIALAEARGFEVVVLEGEQLSTAVSSSSSVEHTDPGGGRW